MPHDVVFWLTDCAPTGRVGVCGTWTVLEEPHAATLDGATQYADVMECAFDIVYGFSSLFHHSFNVVDLVRTVFAVPGVCKMTTVTGIRLFSAMFGSTEDTNS